MKVDCKACDATGLDPEFVGLDCEVCKGRRFVAEASGSEALRGAEARIDRAVNELLALKSMLAVLDKNGLQAASVDVRAGFETSMLFWPCNLRVVVKHLDRPRSKGMMIGVGIAGGLPVKFYRSRDEACRAALKLLRRTQKAGTGNAEGSP